MVLAKQIPFTSVCEHHMLPFTGVAYLGYLPGDRILGLSKLARLVEHFAAAPQMQERLTKQIAEWLNEHLQPGGVGVVLQAEHTSMTLRGVQAHDARMITSELLGALRDDPAARGEFYALTGVARTRPFPTTVTGLPDRHHRGALGLVDSAGIAELAS
jgi:GTP cyclohydrolase I